MRPTSAGLERHHICVAHHHQLPAISRKLDLRRDRVPPRFFSHPRAHVGTQAQSKPAERRQRRSTITSIPAAAAGNFVHFRPHRLEPRQYADPARRRGRDRRRARRVRTDERVPRPDARSVRRMAAAASAWRRQATRLRARPAGEPAARHRARLCGRAQGAAQPTFAQRWTAWGAGFGGSGTRQRRSGSRIEQRHHQRPTAMRPAWIITSRPIRCSASRSPAAAPIGTWRKALGTGRSDAFQAGVYGMTHSGPAYLGRRAGLRQQLVHHQPHARSATSSPRISRARATRRGSKAATASPCRLSRRCRRDALRGDPGAGLPHAVLQRDRSTGGGFGLSYNAMSGTDTRSELGARFDDLTALAPCR